jgi:5-hydroxyisourate hydrolase
MAVGAGRLTLHVLDTATGRPAAGLAVSLHRITAAGREELGGLVTNADGRGDAPLLAGAAMTSGTYELAFDIAAWQRAQGADPGFYDIIPLRFRITDPDAHVHVPLLLSPFGYTTYRGS